MNDITKNLQNIILEECDLINHKIRGVNFLEILKVNIIKKIEPIIEKFSNDDNSNLTFNFTKNEKSINVKLIQLNNSSSFLNQSLDKNTLYISILGVLRFDLLSNENKAIIKNINIFPKMGICLPANTKLNLSSINKILYLIIEISDKIDEV